MVGSLKCHDNDTVWSRDTMDSSPVNTVWLEKALMVCWGEGGTCHSLLSARAREAAGFHWPWLPLGAGQAALYFTSRELGMHHSILLSFSSCIHDLRALTD